MPSDSELIQVGEVDSISECPASYHPVACQSTINRCQGGLDQSSLKVALDSTRAIGD